jgi:hypothetical protein
MQAVNITRPQLEFEEVAIHRYNSTAYVAGKHTWSSMTMTVEDDIAGLASAVIKAQLETQQRLVGVDLDGRWLNTAATGSDYKFGVKLEGLDGDELVVERWIMEGTWIQAVEFSENDYTASEASTINVTLRFDHARADNVGDLSGLGTALGGTVN